MLPGRDQNVRFAPTIVRHLTGRVLQRRSAEEERHIRYSILKANGVTGP